MSGRFVREGGSGLPTARAFAASRFARSFASSATTGPSPSTFSPAASFGRARWLGPVPADLLRVEILAFAASTDLRLDRMRGLGSSQLILAGLRRHPVATLVALLRWPLRDRRGRMLGWQDVFDVRPLERIAAFAADRRRSVEPDGIDAGDPGGPPIAFAIGVDAGDEPALVRTLSSVAALAGGGIRVYLAVADQPGCEAAERAVVAAKLARDAISIAVRPGATSASRRALELASRAEEPWIGWLRPGDRLVPETAIALRDRLAAEPDLQVLYADSLLIDGQGRIRGPELKPDWSPTFAETRDYVARPTLFRRDVLGAVAAAVAPDDPSPWWGALRLAGATVAAIGHLRRPLLLRLADASSAPHAVPASPARAAAGATIIIPTRNRADLLERAVSSIRKWTPSGSYELVIVDNGSGEAAARACLAALDQQADVRVLDRAGPFNFSALANAGAAAARQDTLVLLNNDCEAMREGWLGRLVTAAAPPQIGAVGAVLVYPDGRLQHAGVALGLGGFAGHRDRKLPGRHPGHLGRLQAAHEVSAVTAACLAVRRRTYQAVGGFDESFAVAFNDIDFCLRLEEAGYRNLLVPDAVLIHAESASRGLDRDGAKRVRFLDEAACFAARWRDRIQLDPYTNPLLATDRFADMLG